MDRNISELSPTQTVDAAVQAGRDGDERLLRQLMGRAFYQGRLSEYLDHDPVGLPPKR